MGSGFRDEGSSLVALCAQEFYSRDDGFELKVQTAAVLEDRSRVEVQCGRGRAGSLGCGYEGVSRFGVLSWPSNTEHTRNILFPLARPSVFDVPEFVVYDT